MTAHRVMITDMMYFSKKVPSIPVQRRMRLGDVMRARQQARRRPSWVVVFTKAFALVAADMPELRRAYLQVPWGHFYEHTISIASITVEKEDRGQRAVFFAKLRDPARHSLGALDRYLKWFVASPKANMGLARLGLWVSLLWFPLRRLLWWWALNSEGWFRSRQFGTFGVSIYSSMGCESLHPLGPLSYVINYGVIDDEGDVTVKLIYDHRVIDGATVGRTLAAFEAALTGPILAELRAMAAPAGQRLARRDA